MRLYNFRKESSERSDASNWAKQLLISDTDYFFDGIEGCNQNAQNQTTNLFERAHVDIDTNGNKSKSDVLNAIHLLETKDALDRKIKFADALGLPLSYVLHNDQLGYVFILEFRNVGDAEIVKSFNSYESFGQYLAHIKGWKSTKKFREYADLPEIDRALRRFGTPWPTNIDCFCSNADGEPLAIIEYQNAKTIGVLSHSNNDYFLCKQKKTIRTDRGSKIIYHDDIRRWTSQEILRVQSGLPLYVITWSQGEHHFQLKEVDQVTFPYFDMSRPDRWQQMNAYKQDLHRFVNDPTEADYSVICSRPSMQFTKENDTVKELINPPVLSRKSKTFPHIYWTKKAIIHNSRQDLSTLFVNWIG